MLGPRSSTFLPGLILGLAMAFSRMWGQPLVSSPSESVAIEAEPGGRVVIRIDAMHADGRPRTLRMLLDTGAETCALDERSAKGLLVGPTRTGRLRGFGSGSLPVRHMALRALTLGGRTFRNIAADRLDLESINRWTDEPLDGVLGMSFLREKTFCIDPEAGAFTWGSPARPLLWFNLIARPSDPRPYASIDAGKGPQEALLDTGAEGTLYGTDVAVDEGCELAGGLGEIQPLAVGRRDVRAFGELFRETRAHSGATLILGTRFLLAGPTVFDFEHQRLGLAMGANGRLLRTCASRDVFCPIAWNRRGTSPFLEVAKLAPCNRWYRAGFRSGDRVLQVMDSAGQVMDSKALNLASLGERIRKGRSLVFRLQRGEQILALNSPPESVIRWFGEE